MSLWNSSIAGQVVDLTPLGFGVKADTQIAAPQRSLQYESLSKGNSTAARKGRDRYSSSQVEKDMTCAHHSPMRSQQRVFLLQGDTAVRHMSRP